MEVISHVCPLQARIHAHEIERKGEHGGMHLLRTAGAQMEDIRAVQGVQDKRPNPQETDRSEAGERILVQDVCLPVVRQVQGHRPGGTVAQEQAGLTALRAKENISGSLPAQTGAKK